MKEYENILIDESGEPGALSVSTRLRSFAELRNGIYTSVERVRLLFPKFQIYYFHENPDFLKNFIARNADVLPLNKNAEHQGIKLELKDFQPWELLEKVNERIADDSKLWVKENKRKILSTLPKGLKFRGNKRDLHIHCEADVYPGVVIDTTHGSVVIDKGAIIKPFTFLEGPLYIGRDAKIDNAKIGGGTIVGHACKIGGEVENSIIGDYSNKHHEGFLGHSIVGRWVNIGAMTTTSDLKNNYGYVKIRIGEISYNTGTIKFGSIIGDYTKLGIGIMLNTGTVIDIGCNVVANRVNGYLSPFLWAVINENDIEFKEKYRLDKFLLDSRTVMSRRGLSLSENDEHLIRAFFTRL